MSLDTVPSSRSKRKSLNANVPAARARRTAPHRMALAVAVVAVALWYTGEQVLAQERTATAVAQATEMPPPTPEILPLPVFDVLTPGVLVSALALVLVSAFFSASETAYFSLNRIRLRQMRESGSLTAMLAAKQMEHPGKLLASMLMGNSIGNIMLGVVVAEPSETYFEKCLLVPSPLSYLLAGVSTATIIIFFAEITPKVAVVRNGERFASIAAIPIALVDLVLQPLRDFALLVVSGVFKITGFSKLPPAPFITDDEFLSVLSEGEATGAIERGEREMIQGILEFSEVMLREVLVPRPDMIALPETATVQEAIALFREQEYARMPVYKENLDNIVGILYAKDLLSFSEETQVARPITPLLRRAHFVPETMTVASFVKMAQRLRTHVAIVVDEYGGTEGLITLQDALREVVGDIGDDVEEMPPLYVKVSEGEYRVDGSLPLHELEDLTGLPFEDEEHTTVAGFLMDKTDKIPEVGDVIEHSGVQFTVEQVDGKRVAYLRLHVLDAPQETAAL